MHSERYDNLTPLLINGGKRANTIASKFMGLYPELDLTIENMEFKDEKTREKFADFTKGFLAAPSDLNSRRFVVGRLTKEGLVIEKIPAIQTNYKIAHAEAERLKEKYLDDFVVFGTVDKAFKDWGKPIIEERKKKNREYRLTVKANLEKTNA